MSAYPASQGLPRGELSGVLARKLPRLRIHRGLTVGALIVAALVAFEAFNFGTTEFALADLLGNVQFAGLPWATLLALAFCGIDFAGLVRLFTPSGSPQDPAEVWYLIGAWFLAATMNATLTWWGVSVALLSHHSLGGAILGADTLQRAAPVFVALLVWLVRVLIIGTLSMAGRRIFALDETRAAPRLRFAPTSSANRPG